MRIVLLSVNVCMHVRARVITSLPACREPGGVSHSGGCSSTPCHAPSAPSGLGRTKPVHFHSPAPAGRILIIISPMMRCCDASHSRSLSALLFLLSLLFTFMVSEEQKKKRTEKILTRYCCLQNSCNFRVALSDQSYFCAASCTTNSFVCCATLNRFFYLRFYC